MVTAQETTLQKLLEGTKQYQVLIGSVVLVEDQPSADVDGVRLATMHAMKGLEFRCVAVLGVGASAVPYTRNVTPAEVDRIQHDSDLLRDRCVLFVACTRACEALHVSWTDQPSPFLPVSALHG
jgi:superfamily I DNA/RNA helicase